MQIAARQGLLQPVVLVANPFAESLTFSDDKTRIRYIQAMLGHAKLEATQIYTRVAIRKLKEVHTATHPAHTERKP